MTFHLIFQNINIIWHDTRETLVINLKVNCFES